MTKTFTASPALPVTDDQIDDLMIRVMEWEAEQELERKADATKAYDDRFLTDFNNVASIHHY